MIRNCIKLCRNSSLTQCLRKQNELLQRAIFIRHISLLKPKINLLNDECPIQNLRYKSKGPKKKEISESELDTQDSDILDEKQDKYSKILTVHVTSLRVDAILKSGLGMARNKIESLFYESKIRLNGEKMKKKSASVQEEDIIDLIKGPDVKNPNFMNVARIEIISVKGNEDSISVKIRRCKSLAVDAYT